jgi:hypothetical protein
MNKDYLNIYANFLIASSKYAHSTDLQKITEDRYSKDKIYRFLSSGEFCEKNFWLTIKPILKSIQNNNACISLLPLIQFGLLRELIYNIFLYCPLDRLDSCAN